MTKNNRPFTLYLASYYFSYFALVGVYIIFLPKALLDLGYSTFEVGIVYAAAPFMRFLLPFLFRKYITLTFKIYLLSLILTFMATLLFISSVNSFEFYLASNLLFGASMGVSLPYVESIALSKLSRSVYGKVRLWGSLGFMGISLLLGKVLTEPGQALDYLSIMAFLTLIFGATLIKYDQNKYDSNEKSSFSLSKYWAFWLSMIMMQIGFGGFYNFFTIYQTQHGVSLEIISWMWSVGIICEILMLYFQGPLLQRNLLNILKFATLITSARWLILYLYPDSITMTFFSQSLHAFSFALYHTAAITYVYTLYTQKKLAQQFFLGIAFGLGGSIGALISGEIYGESIFLIESIITFISFMILLIHQKRI
ncbi:Probable 3-phenylpropionic acid transporter [hydrothermal vent metagenome]|uniref:Probable 3-phenylpropionic acid transporter n=1 Tax=hydrothermal vent metagenome TaxID=652676 RepID=A0A1W1EBD9_9ZZZZ